jgi:hypothetical protein
MASRSAPHRGDYRTLKKLKRHLLRTDASICQNDSGGSKFCYMRMKKPLVYRAVTTDTAGEFGERYGTGSGSDLVDSEVVTYKAPGRYRSLYRTNSPAVSPLMTAKCR